jgi:hypothetical protein
MLASTRMLTSGKRLTTVKRSTLVGISNSRHFPMAIQKGKAQLDLHGKCSGVKCHALLIGLRPDGESELDVCWDGGYLRITALLRTAP